jgi:hypothetical protein
MANKTQRSNKGTKKEKGTNKKSKALTPYQRECAAGRKIQRQKHVPAPTVGFR